MSVYLQPLKYKIAISHDSKDYYEQYRSQTLFGDDVLPIKLGMEEMPTIDAESEDRSPEGWLLLLFKSLHAV